MLRSKEMIPDPWLWYPLLNILGILWIFSEVGAWAMVKVPYIRTMVVGYMLCFISSLFHYVTDLFSLKISLLQFTLTISFITLLGRYMATYEEWECHR
jgi:hypothetical protein